MVIYVLENRVTLYTYACLLEAQASKQSLSYDNYYGTNTTNCTYWRARVLIYPVCPGKN